MAEEINREDFLLRRLPIQPQYFRDDNSISSLAFKPRKVDVDGLSVDLERLTTHAEAILDRTRFRLCRVQASVPFDLGLECIHSPKPEEPAHSLVRGNFSTQVRRTLSNSAVLLVEI